MSDRWSDPEPVPGEAHAGGQWGWECYRTDGAGGGTYRVGFVAGGTGACWNLSVDERYDANDEPIALLHVCDLDAFIEALQRFAVSAARRAAEARWE